MDNAGLYKELIECSDNIVLVTDSSFKIRYISSAVQKTFEIPPNKLVGRDVFEFVDADKIQLWKDCLEERQQNSCSWEKSIF
jgi:PAS domain S-box-containing protein